VLAFKAVEVPRAGFCAAATPMFGNLMADALSCILGDVMFPCFSTAVTPVLSDAIRDVELPQSGISGCAPALFSVKHCPFFFSVGQVIDVDRRQL
jgi:hypothetical protein